MKWVEQLVTLLGSEQVSLDEPTRREFGSDKWFAHHLPDVVVHPRSTAEVVSVLRFANNHRIPVTPRGAGYGYVGGCVPEKGGIELSMMRMNEILEISVEDGVARVQPGVLTGELQSQVRAQGLYYPPDPASFRNCSIGGNIATNAGGPRCLKYGVTRHFVLGLEVVLADGSVIQAGGRTIKNKTGFDLVGLFVGSEGMLGVVTEITLRLLPLPPARASLSAGFKTIEQAAEAVQRILGAGFLPSALEIADRFTLESAREHLQNRIVPEGEAHLLVDLDGQERSVQTDLEQLRQLVQSLGALNLETAYGEAECERLWDLRRGFSESLKATGLKKLNQDVVVPRGRIVDLVEFAGQLQEQHGFPIACFGHAGDGNIHVNIMVGAPEETEQQANLVLDALFAQVLAWKGAITGEHGVGLAKKPWWPSAVSSETLQLHRVLKNALDPNGILNPGKFL
jgi:glycolate oxidase